MKSNRRGFLGGGVAAAIGFLGAAAPPGRGAGVPAGIDAPLPVQTPDVPRLGYELDGDVKVFRLRAEVVSREFVPGRSFDVWGYNGSCPGPTIEVNQGDRVRVIVENRLPEATSMH
ncbi:MAG TPA: multicopper oxidase domain-containing protein, partial [Methylomirabilota bacterium]